jgi:hypothetical protein
VAEVDELAKIVSNGFFAISISPLFGCTTRELDSLPGSAIA